MRINPYLGMYAPGGGSYGEREKGQSASATPYGGLKNTVYSEFLFAPRLPVRKMEILPGGHMDGTGGSAFESTIPFVGESNRSFLVLYCSFVDGIDRGIQLPLLYTLKTHFHMSQLAASAAIGISLSPWLAKPFLALITDTVPIFGYKRKPYIFASALVNAASLFLIGYLSVTDVSGGFLVPLTLMTLRTFGRAMIDAAAQGMLLEDCRDDTAPLTDVPDQSVASVQISRYQAAHRLGQFLNVCASGYLISTTSITAVYFSMAAVHVGTMVLAYTSDEQRVERPDHHDWSGEIAQKYSQLKLAVSESPPFRNVIEYMFLSVVVPSYEAPMAYYLLDARHFSIASLSIINVVQTLGSLLAPVVYAQFFQRSKYSTLMASLTMASIPASLMPIVITTGLAAKWHMNEVAWAAVSAFTLTLVNDLQLLPAHILVAQIAPRGLEGSSLSVLTVVEGGGRAISNIVSSLLPSVFGAVAPRYKNMTIYVVVCTVFNVGPFTAIDGFDHIGRRGSQVEELDSSTPVPLVEGVLVSSPSFGGVMKELRGDDAVSLLSSGSDLSPAASQADQVRIIVPTSPTSPN
jgi:hypothetical protein